VLKANDVEACIVQKLGSLNILGYCFVVDLEVHVRWIVISVTVVRHCDDASLQIRASHRDRSPKILGKRSDSAAAWKMIANESNTLDRVH
jgi:hypothetical protein